MNGGICEMTPKQINIFGEEVTPRPVFTNKEKRNWENRFQRWSNKQLHDGATPLGKCGYSVICEYCENNGYGRPCVRALNECLRANNKHIDYDTTAPEDAWYINYPKEGV